MKIIITGLLDKRMQRYYEAIKLPKDQKSLPRIMVSQNQKSKFFANVKFSNGKKPVTGEEVQIESIASAVIFLYPDLTKKRVSDQDLDRAMKKGTFSQIIKYFWFANEEKLRIAMDFIKALDKPIKTS